MGDRRPRVAARMFGELAIAPRADPHQADERAPHHVDAAEPRGRGHVLQAVIGALEQPPSRLTRS